MQYSEELERMVQIVESCVAILRELAGSQDEATRRQIDDIAVLMDAAADQLAELVRAPALQ